MGAASAQAEISANTHLPTPLDWRPPSRVHPRKLTRPPSRLPLYTTPSLLPISRLPLLVVRTVPTAIHHAHRTPPTMPDGSFAHPQQRQFNPYPDNGGTTLAMPRSLNWRQLEMVGDALACWARP